MTVDVGYQLRGGLIDCFKTFTEHFQLLVLRPRCDIPKAVFAGGDAVVGTHGKGNAFCLDFLGVAVFQLLIEEAVCGNITADKVQAFLLGQIQSAVFAKVKGLCCENRTGVIDGYMIFHGDRHTGVIVRATEVITEQPLGNILVGNTTVREKPRNIEDFDLLVFLCILGFCHLFLIVELGMGNLVNHGRNRLDFAHALTNGNTLIVQREKAVRAVVDRLDVDRHRRGTA